MQRISAIFAFLFTLFWLTPGHTEPDAAPERIVWDKVPIQITLPVGTERLVTFPVNVRLGIPAALTAKLRSQSHQGTVYWLAHEPFAPTRIQIQGIDSGHIFLVDLTATQYKPPVTPVEIQLKAQNTTHTAQQQPNSFTSLRPISRDYVLLTRFAAQQLYAPARLLKIPPGIHRSAVQQKPLSHLIRGVSVESTPIAAWRKGRLYVTALQLNNQSDQPVLLDPRLVRGQWRTVTFQHARLQASGSELDTTALYLISDRPFLEAL